VSSLRPDDSRAFLVAALDPAARLDRGRDVLLLQQNRDSTLQAGGLDQPSAPASAAESAQAAAASAGAAGNAPEASASAPPAPRVPPPRPSQQARP
jgi:rod shape-determining protein MreC